MITTHAGYLKDMPSYGMTIFEAQVANGGNFSEKTWNISKFFREFFEARKSYLTLTINPYIFDDVSTK